ncbi:hypothetical protein DFQ27_000755 [Actinomortierella ambigua]|uniref:Uncharacterized protein n=1 Tax=Actinomortierella ambigua TaxID=1343610 RepID=A0A9P6QE72_9FUNG|nr:hypothetical protein DFQ27_000755 [Actinomortierella ambigua]
MPTSYSKLVIQNATKLVPSKYMQRLNLELKRTFIVIVSLLKTHRRKAFLLSLGPSTIIKIVTVLLPIMKLLPPTIKAIQSLSYFRKTTGRDSAGSTTGTGASTTSNSTASLIAGGTAVDGSLGLTMDELFDRLWTPSTEDYWERVHATVSRSGLCQTLGTSLCTVQPGCVEVLLPFRTELSGEASLLPMLIALTCHLAGLTLLPRHFTLKPIDLKCNILSGCDASTTVLVARGAVLVRGEHSITAKVEVLKASGPIVPGLDGHGADNSTNQQQQQRQSSRGWLSRTNSRSSNNKGNNNSNNYNATTSNQGSGVIHTPGTGLDRSQWTLCATGLQTNVVVRAGTDVDDEQEEAREMQRLREERRQQRRRGRRTASPSNPWRSGSSGSSSTGGSHRGSNSASSSRSSSLSITPAVAAVSSPAMADAQDQSILLGDTLLTSPVSASPTSEPLFV